MRCRQRKNTRLSLTGKARLGEVRRLIRQAILEEGRYEDTAEKMRPESDDPKQALYDDLLTAMTSPQVKKPDYLAWAWKQVRTEGGSALSPAQVASLLDRFEKNKQRLPSDGRLLSKYRSVTELRAALDSLGLSRKQISQEGKVAFEDENFLVVQPTSTRASCQFGSNTKWCVSATKGKNYFTQYAGQDTFLYFVLAKGAMAYNLQSNEETKDLAKVAFAFNLEWSGGVSEGNVEVYDSADNALPKWRKILADAWGADKSGHNYSDKIFKALGAHAIKDGQTGYRETMEKLTLDQLREMLGEAEGGSPGGAGQLAIQWLRQEIDGVVSDKAVRQAMQQAATGVHTVVDDTTGQVRSEIHYERGQPHRLGAPAVIDYEQDHVMFYVNGMKHRDDGPAVVGNFLSDDEMGHGGGYDINYWFLDGKQVQQFTARQTYEEAKESIPAAPLNQPEWMKRAR